MKLRECCKSCKYSRGVQSSPTVWCLLRKIRLNSKIAAFAYCHHWTHTEPSVTLANGNNLISDTQLDFERDLLVNLQE